MKILSLNAACFLGFDGTRESYVKNPLKPIKGDPDEERSNLREFVEIVETVAPDVVLLQEVDCGSFRTSTDCQVKCLAAKLSGSYEFHTGLKYRGRIIPSLPILRRLCHGMLYKNGHVENHFIDTGIRSLVQELILPGISIFSVHLANRGDRFRRKDIRKSQLKEIIDIAINRDRYIIAGDFNFANGLEEREWLRAETDCELALPGKTYPTSSPEYFLDMAAMSGDIELLECQTISTHISDHYPFVIDITY